MISFYYYYYYFHTKTSTAEHVKKSYSLLTNLKLAFLFFTNTHNVIFASETFNSCSKENPFYYGVPNKYIYIGDTYFTPLSFLLSFFEKYLFFALSPQNEARINIIRKYYGHQKKPILLETNKY